MYKELISWLKQQGIEFEAGLTDNEISKVQTIYEILFPESFRFFLMEGLPVSRGFYNWRNTEQTNIEFIKRMITMPIDTIDEVVKEICWCDDWGKEPQNAMEAEKTIRKKLHEAPKLLPVYGHRYMPMLSGVQVPVISVHGTDIIYYGESLSDYFYIEFGTKKQEEIDFDSIRPIPFWSDIM